MKYLIYSLVILAAWHFVYDGILLPSFRLKLRYRLFELRDRLRLVKVQERSKLSDEVFSTLQGGINTGLRLLPYTDFHLAKRIDEAIRSDEGLRRRIEQRVASVAACPVEEAKQIYADLQRVAGDAFFANTAGWLIYVLPVILSIFFIQSIKERIQQVISIPEPEVTKVVHPSCVEAMVA
jgi:hypothetical protein